MKDIIFLSALFGDIVNITQEEIKNLKLFKDISTNNPKLCLLLDCLVLANNNSKLEDSDVRTMYQILEQAQNLVQGMHTNPPQHKSWKEPLRSVFNEVQLPNQKKSDNVSYQPICDLSMDGYEFVQTNPIDNYVEQYKKQWVGFLEEIQGASFEPNTFNTLLAIYKKYFWCVPALFNDMSLDISQYEHARLTAAVAVSLYEEFRHNNIQHTDNSNDLKAHCYLVCGDVTGIQSYIYNVGHKQAAKALKGRSFFLNQVVDAVARKVLAACGLTNANLIYSSGGKFYALIPAYCWKEYMPSLIEETEKYFLETYDGDLGFIIGGVPITNSDFEQSKISAKWADVNKELEKSKRQKFKSCFTSGSDFFQPFGVAGRVVQCQNTKKDLCETKDLEGLQPVSMPFGTHFEKYIVPVTAPTAAATPHKSIAIYKDKEEGADKRFISEEQFHAIFLGNKLKDSKGDSRSQKLSFYEHKDNGIQIQLPHHVLGFSKQTNYPAYSVHFNNNQDLAKYLKYPSFAEWKFYGGDWQCDEFDALLSSADLAFKRLGVLRMDVDNLGVVFQKGFMHEDHKASFARVVQLSTMLDFFFCGYLNKLKNLKWDKYEGVGKEAGELLENLIQIVYSGGDDIFVVGRWDVLPDVAHWINAEFTKYTNKNPSLTISAGISLFTAGYPLFKAAEEAGDAEHKAKGDRTDKSGKSIEKNAICLFDVPMSWDDFEKVVEWKNILVQHIDNKELSRGVIERLYQFHSEYLASGSDTQKPNLWGKWRWRAAYSLSQYAKELKKESVKKDLCRLAADLFISAQTEQDFIILLQAIARWVDFLTRK